MGTVDEEGDSRGLVVSSSPSTCLYIGDDSPQKAQYEDIAYMWCIDAMSKCGSRDDDVLEKQVSKDKNQGMQDSLWSLRANLPTLGLIQPATYAHGNGKSSQGWDKWPPAVSSTC